MVSVYDVNSVGSAVSFVIWTLVVVSLGKALFGSFVMGEIVARINQRSFSKRERIGELTWEIKNRAHYDPDVVMRSPHAAKRPLEHQELISRRLELEQLTRGTVWARAFRYFTSCWACQSFWAALGLCLLLGEPRTSIVDALAYSASAVLVMSLFRSRNESQPAPRGKAGGCSGPGCQG